jgi:pyruvate formate lyase activating enzyme
MTEALFYEKKDNQQVKCLLCPHFCTIDNGRFGTCKVRRNRGGVLSSETYGKLSSLQLDLIEKKPLYHFYPGSQILSLGSVGCNLHCSFCQNHALSQCGMHKPPLIKSIGIDELIETALNSTNNIGVAFTYNEPIVNFEYVTEVAKHAQAKKLKTVLVSNGYINPDPMHHLLQHIDAFNIDLKAFNNQFYQKQTRSSLEPVKESLKSIAKSGKHLEITNLVIPTYNDDTEEFEAMCNWIAKELGPDTPLHLSKYFPRFEMNQYPTPAELLFELYDLAKSILNHVYIGNLATELHSNTFCPQCRKTLIKRTYYHITNKAIDSNGNCSNCKHAVIKYMLP